MRLRGWRMNNSNWQHCLKEWRVDRNIVTPSGKVFDMIKEELNELEDAIYDKDEHETVDALADIIVLATNELELMGYDLDGVMIEVVKEISSRRQCPAQKEVWGKWGAEGKWQKQKNQTDTYKAVYK